MLFLSGINSITPPKEELAANFSFGNILGNAEGYILVRVKSNIGESERSAFLERNNLKTQSEIKQIGVFLFSISKSERPERTIERLLSKEHSIIDFAEVDAILAPSLIPNDPEYINEWHHPLMNAPFAWDTTTGANITIAIADTGIDPSHPDLAPRLIPGWNFFNNTSDASDVKGHGTAVAGTAAAVGNNGLGVAGIAHNALLMPLRVSDDAGNATYSAIANAIAYAADNGVKIVNVSYQAGGSKTVERAANYLRRKGGITVIAEGNTGGRSFYNESQSMISVSATTNADLRASWSTYGDDVDLSAPGQAILTTRQNGITDYYSGTSFSAPLVSGLIALIWSANPSLDRDAVQNILFRSSKDLGTPGWDEYYGWGRIDAGEAVTLAKNTVTEEVTNPSKGQKNR